MQIQGKYRCINCFKELNSEDETCSCGYDISQYKPAMHRLSPGTVLDNRYYIGRVIGEGGFGITYVGYDANLEIRLAIKEFFLSGVNTRNTTYSDDIESSAAEKEELFETYREKFINEAKVLARFNNEDGIVTVYNFFKANNTAYIIMEFLDGLTLKEYLKSKGRLSVDEVVKIFLPIMQTLDKVHTTKLIHRDISPDNIIFTENGKVKLLDFGAAREVSDDGNKSLSVVLKHGYAPPEQYQSHGKQGSWTDTYALSATIYKCLTGKTPTEAMERAMGEELEPVCDVAPGCPQNISDVIMKGLEIKITNRYQSMGEMAEALKEAYKIKGTSNIPAPDIDSEATILASDQKDEITIETKPIEKVPVQIDISQYAGLKSAVVGDIIRFGNMTWRVLAKGNNNLFVITEKVVDKQPFNTANARCSWNSSTLRAWLNNEFYNKAFTESEKQLISQSNVDGQYDNIYLLSAGQAKNYFRSDSDRVGVDSTERALGWWTRSPIYDSGNNYYGSRVSYDGYISVGNYSVDNCNCGVRPVLSIDLSKL